MHRLRNDVGIIIAVLFFPIVIVAVFESVGRSLPTESARGTANIIYMIISLVWWFAILGWCIARLITGGRQKWPCGGLRVAALVINIFLCPLGCPGYVLYIPVHILFRVLPDQHRLQYDLNHMAIAEACASVMGQYENFSERQWDDPAFPAILRDIRPMYISVRENGIMFQMHGGFDHYGMFFERENSNTWGLWYGTENYKTQLVYGINVNDINSRN